MPNCAENLKRTTLSRDLRLLNVINPHLKSCNLIKNLKSIIEKKSPETILFEEIFKNYYIYCTL